MNKELIDKTEKLLSAREKLEQKLGSQPLQLVEQSEKVVWAAICEEHSSAISTRSRASPEEFGERFRASPQELEAVVGCPDGA